MPYRDPDNYYGVKDKARTKDYPVKKIKAHYWKCSRFFTRFAQNIMLDYSHRSLPIIEIDKMSLNSSLLLNLSQSIQNDFNRKEMNCVLI